MGRENDLDLYLDLINSEKEITEYKQCKFLFKFESIDTDISFIFGKN